MPAKISKNEFLLKLENSHNGTIKRLRFPEYTKSDTLHKVRCIVCDYVWEAQGYSLTSKNPSGCPNCAKQNAALKLTTSLTQFLKQLKDAHGTNIEYVEGYTKVGERAVFKCSVCNNTWKTKCISLVKKNPHGCPKCARYKNIASRTKTTNQFKKEVAECHGNSITILGEYTVGTKKIAAQCNKCSFVWKPIANNLISNKPSGCPNCKAIKFGLLSTKSEFEYRQQLFKAHGNRITLISDYKKQTSSLQFQCDKGHTWWTSQTSALIANNPSGCPQCGYSISKGEKSLFEFVKKYAPDAEQSVRMIKNPKTGGRLEWDIYIPSKNIAIEYNGVYFHSYPKKPKNYHALKSQLSKSQYNVRVIHITDIEWETNTNLVKKTLRHILNVSSERYYARKLKVVKREKLGNSHRTFYQKNHLQGDPIGGISYVLLDPDNAIKAIMSFSAIQSVRGTKHVENSWELIRFASKGCVIGGASRLFSAFLRDYCPKYIISYSQNDWFDGSMYSMLGFKKTKDCVYDYRTVWDGQLRHKSYTRRRNLAKLLGSNFDPNETEQQNLINNNIPIVYDSGKTKWEWKLDIKLL